MRKGDNLATFMCRVSSNLEPHRPLIGVALLFLYYHPIYQHHSILNHVKLMGLYPFLILLDLFHSSLGNKIKKHWGYNASLMSVRRILSQYVPVNADFLCDKAAVLGDIIKETPVLLIYLWL